MSDGWFACSGLGTCTLDFLDIAHNQVSLPLLFLFELLQKLEFFVLVQLGREVVVDDGRSSKLETVWFKTYCRVRSLSLRRTDCLLRRLGRLWSDNSSIRCICNLFLLLLKQCLQFLGTFSRLLLSIFLLLSQLISSSDYFIEVSIIIGDRFFGLFLTISNFTIGSLWSHSALRFLGD